MLLKNGIYCYLSDDMKLTKSYQFKDIDNIIAMCQYSNKHEIIKNVLWKLCRYMNISNANMIAAFMNNSNLAIHQTLGYLLQNTLSVDVGFHDNVNIPFSTPDSSGVCSISGDTELTIKCDNTEEFKVSQITVPAQVINDNAGNPVFRIPEDFTAPTQFACAISENSTRTSGADGEEEGVARRYYNNKSSSGLSGGAIAAIVICSVAAVAIVGVIAVLMRKSIFGGAKVAPDTSIDNNTTVNKFVNNEIPKV